VTRSPVQRIGTSGLRPPATFIALAVLLAALLATQSAQAQTFTVMYNFLGFPNSQNPYAGLVRDNQGNLYGTTYAGGAGDVGTVFKLNASGKELLLHSFSGDQNGFNPDSGLTMDAAGTLYGTTEYGGNFTGACNPHGCGTVFKLTKAGKQTSLYMFTGSAGDGFGPITGVVLDQAGNLYGTTEFGGDPTCGAQQGCGTIFKVDATGKETILHAFTASGGDGAYPVADLLLSGGQLYGTTSGGGTFAYGTVFKSNPETGAQTVLYTFKGGADGGSPYGSLIRDSAGNLYGTTYTGGAHAYGTVFKLTKAGKEKVLYSFKGGADGANPAAGVARDKAGNLYGTTYQGGTFWDGTVFKLDTTGKETVLHSFASTDGAFPESVLIQDKEGNLYGTTPYGGATGGLAGDGVVFKLTP